jgi:hypothetical protein
MISRVRTVVTHVIWDRNWANREKLPLMSVLPPSMGPISDRPFHISHLLLMILWNTQMKTMLTAQVQRDQSFGACSKLNTPKLIEGEVQLIGIRQPCVSKEHLLLRKLSYMMMIFWVFSIAPTFPGLNECLFNVYYQASSVLVSCFLCLFFTYWI